MPSTEEGRFYMPPLMMQLLCLLSAVKYDVLHFINFFADAYTRYSFQLSNTFLCLQLNNLELAVNLAKRANLPGAENLVNFINSMLL